MGEPTSDQLRWNQYRKQFLLDDKARNYFEVIKAQLGLHSTDYWTPYLSVWARIGDFDAKDMFESLNSGRKIVRTHAFRKTVHVMHMDNFSMILSATGPALYRAYRTDRYRKMDVLSDYKIEEMLFKVKDALKDGPLRTRGLKKVLPGVGNHVRSVLLMLMARGEVIRAKASHARSNLTSYALLNQWVPDFTLKLIDEDEALTDLIKNHIERFGPVTVDDISWWLRITKTSTKEAISRLDEGLVKIHQNDSEYYMESSDYEMASSIEIPKDDTIWFLPYEDHFLKAVIDRTHFISEDIHPMLFPADKNHFWPSNPDAPKIQPSKGLRATGEVRPTIWLNGQVIGRWEIDDDEKHKKIVTSIYKKATKKKLAHIEQRRNELEEFVNRRLLPISGG